MSFERWLYTVPLMIRSLFRRKQVEQELDEELRYHLEQQTSGNLAQGMAPEEASRAARRSFGGIEQHKEEIRDTRGVRMIEDLAGDLGYAVRVYARQPGFAVVAVLTLGLGIGTATAAFGVLDTVLLRGLPYPASERLVTVWASFPEWRNSPTFSALADEMSVPYRDYLEWTDQQTVFEDTASYGDSDAAWVAGGRPRTVRVGHTTNNLFSLLGVSAHRGRLFGSDPRADSPDAMSSAILSYGAWQGDFGGDDVAIGAPITLDIGGRRETFRIIGVLPRSFEFTSQDGTANPAPDIWLSISNRSAFFGGEIVARLKSGVTLARAEEETDRIFTELPFASIQFFEGADTHGARLIPRHEEETRHTQSTLFVLFGGAAVLLLIACGNVANLLLGRGVTREHEVTMRVAMGASRGRICRQLLTESLVLTTAGGLVGVLIAYWGVEAFTAWLPADFPRTGLVTTDMRVLAFALGVSVVTAGLFGVAPMLSVRRNLNTALIGSTRSHASTRLRFQQVILVMEISLSFVLLVGAGLLTQSLVRLTAVDSGLESEGLLTARIGATSRYQMPPELLGGTDGAMQSFLELGDRVQAFRAAVVDSVESIPGVESVAAMDADVPFSGEHTVTSFQIEGSSIPDVMLEHRGVSPNYFDVTGVPVIEGRMFTEGESRGEQGLILVNQEAARRYWQNGAVGRTVTSGDQVSTVIGVVGNVRDYGLQAEAVPILYQPMWGQVGGSGLLSLLIRTRVEALSVVEDVYDAIWAVDPEVPINRVDTMHTLVRATHLTERHRAVMIAVFALLAGILALVGLYGVVSRFVACSSFELSVRSALGAPPVALLRLVLAQTAWLVTVGIAIGIGGAVVATRIVAGLLFDTSALDVPIYVGIAVALACVSMLAGYIPARGAARSDPMGALRAE